MRPRARRCAVGGGEHVREAAAIRTVDQKQEPAPLESHLAHMTQPDQPQQVARAVVLEAAQLQEQNIGYQKSIGGPRVILEYRIYGLPAAAAGVGK